MNTASSTVDELERRQAAFARRIATALDERSVPHDIEQRLRVSRDMAVARARTARARVPQRQHAGSAVMVGRGEAALGSGGSDPSSWWVSSTLLAFVALLIAGLLAIDYRNEQVKIEAAGEVDAALLADDLPPAAYSDAGFREFLRLPVPASPTQDDGAD